MSWYMYKQQALGHTHTHTHTHTQKQCTHKRNSKRGVETHAQTFTIVALNQDTDWVRRIFSATSGLTHSTASARASHVGVDLRHSAFSIATNWFCTPVSSVAILLRMSSGISRSVPITFQSEATGSVNRKAVETLKGLSPAIIIPYIFC